MFLGSEQQCTAIDQSFREKRRNGDCTLEGSQCLIQPIFCSKLATLDVGGRCGIGDWRGSGSRIATPFHRETLGGLAALPALPHGYVRRLQIARKTRRIEQRTNVTILRKLGLYRGARIGFMRQAQSHCFIGGKGIGDHLRHADRVQQARSYPSCESLSENGQHW